MAKNSYGRSLSWYLSFFGLPLVAFAFMFLEVSNWADPIWGPQARTEKKLAADRANQAALNAEGQETQQLSEQESKTVETENKNREAQPNTGEDAAPHEGERVETEKEEPQPELAKIETEPAGAEEDNRKARNQAEDQETNIRYVLEKTTLILAAIGLFPYLGLLFRLTERLRITDKSIRRLRLFKSRKVVWDNLIECRDFLNYIHLVPTDRSSEMYIDYYQTFRRHDHLWRRITRKSREVEANMMVGRRRGRIASCDLGLVPSLLFVAASAATLILLRQRIVLLGVLSGMVLALTGAYIWITTRLSPRRWKSGGFAYVTLFALSLILPPAYFAQEIYREGKEAFMLFGALYFVGLLAGSGLVSMLLPSRKRR